MATNDKVQKLSGEAFSRLKSDHEQFLEAYEKPTQIYRFLKARHSLRPLFLHRNLSYLRMHRNASGTKRKRTRKLRINDLLQHTKDTKPDLENQIKSDNHLKISLAGLEKGIDFTELLEEASGCSKPTNQNGETKSHDSQLVEVEILLYRFSQPSVEALLSGRKNSFHCTCSSLGKRVIEYNTNVNKNKRTSLPLMVPESSLTWKGRERPGGTQMLVFRASCCNADRANASGKTAARGGRRKNRRKVPSLELNRLKKSDVSQSSHGASSGDDGHCQILRDVPLQENHTLATSTTQVEEDTSKLERDSFCTHQVPCTDLLTGEIVATSSCRPNSIPRNSNIEANQGLTTSSYETRELSGYKSSSKVKPQMKDACVMTDITFGSDDISELTPVYQSQIASLTSSEGNRKDLQNGSSSAAVCNGSHSRIKKSVEANRESPSRPVSPTHSRQDKCTSPLIPKLMLRNGVLNRFVNGYAAPEITALRENAIRVQTKRKLFLSTKNRRATLKEHRISCPVIRQTSPMVCSAPEDDLIRLIDKSKVSTFRPSSLKRLGSGKQGSHSFLISFPRSHYDNLRNVSFNKTAESDSHSSFSDAQESLQESGSFSKNSSLGKSVCKNSSQRRRTEIQLLLDGDKPRGQRLSADEIPMIMAEDVSSWSLTTPEKSSWLGSSTRKITPVDHFSFPIQRLSSGSPSGSSLSGSLSNHRKRAFSEDSENSSITSPPFSIPPMKSLRVSSPPLDPNVVNNKHLPLSSSSLPRCNHETHRQGSQEKRKEFEIQSTINDERSHSLQPSSLKNNSSLKIASSFKETCLRLDEVFCAELVVFDSRGDCLLKNGEYSILMQKCLKSEDEDPKDLLKFEPLSWSSIFGGQDSRTSSRKSRNLLLSFSLCWTDGPPRHQLCSEIDTALDLKKIRETYYPPRSPSPSLSTNVHPQLTPPPSGKTNSLPPLTTDIELSTQLNPQVIENIRGSLKSEGSTSSHMAGQLGDAAESAVFQDSSRTKPNSASMDVDPNLSLVPLSSSGIEPPSLSVDKEKIFFNFLYGNNSLQQTECREDMQCPWCFLRCSMFYCLLKHMSLCHPRFHFTYSPSLDRAKVIDVHVNKLYDTSSSIERDPGERSSISLMKKRQRPSKCFSCTCVLVEKGPAMEIGGLSEFLNDGSWRRGFNSNRMYYHASSCVPMLEEEVQVDSEGEESSLGWQKFCSQKMLDEFTDVNKGEKRLMKLWNMFIIENRLIAEKQIPSASVLFAQSKKQILLEEKIDRNFLSHLTSLYDFGLLQPVTIRQCMSILYEV